MQKFYPGDVVIYVGYNGKSQQGSKIGAVAVVQNPAYEMTQNGGPYLCLKWTDPIIGDNLRNGQHDGGYNALNFKLKSAWTNEDARALYKPEKSMPFQIGDQVVVYRKFMKENSSFVWISPDMDNAIGKEGIIKKVPKSKTCPTYSIEFKDTSVKCIYWFPEEALAANNETAIKLQEEERKRQLVLAKLNAYKSDTEVRKFLKEHKQSVLKRYKVELGNSQTDEFFSSNDEEAIKLVNVKYRNRVMVLYCLNESNLLNANGHSYPAQWNKILPLPEKKVLASA